MNRIISTALALISSFSVTPFCRGEQTSPIVQFLARMASAPASESTSDDDAPEAQSLSALSRHEIEASLPGILRYADDTSQNSKVRGEAAVFLLVIAMRVDGPDLLSTHAADVAELLTDSNAPIQRIAIAITDWLVAGSNAQQSGIYLTALTTAVRNPSTPQDVAAQMLAPLVRLGSGQRAAVESAHTFLTRPDLNSQAKAETVRSLAGFSDLPEQISQDLCTRFDDPDPQVRVEAVIAYSRAASQRDNAKAYVRGEFSIPGEDPQDAALRRKAAASALESSSTFVTEARKRVERIAADETENPKLRQLAEDALAGRTPLNPNILLPNVAEPEVKPRNPQ